jgi:hypothetical protein
MGLLNKSFTSLLGSWLHEATIRNSYSYFPPLTFHSQNKITNILTVVCKQINLHHGDRKSAPAITPVLLEATPLVGVLLTILGALRKAVV